MFNGSLNSEICDHHPILVQNCHGRAVFVQPRCIHDEENRAGGGIPAPAPHATKLQWIHSEDCRVPLCFLHSTPGHWEMRSTGYPRDHANKRPSPGNAHRLQPAHRGGRESGPAMPGTAATPLEPQQGPRHEEVASQDQPRLAEQPHP